MPTIIANKRIYFLNITEKFNWMTSKRPRHYQRTALGYTVRINVYIYRCLMIDKEKTLINEFNSQSRIIIIY